MLYTGLFFIQELKDCCPSTCRTTPFFEGFGEGKSCGTFQTILSGQTGASLLSELQADNYAISGKDVAIFDEDEGVNEEIGLYKSSHHSKNSENSTEKSDASNSSSHSQNFGRQFQKLQ